MEPSVRMDTRLKMAFVVAAAVLGIAVGSLSARPAWDAWRQVEAGDDPSALADLRVEKVLTPARADAEIHAAIEAKDLDLAMSFVELAKAGDVAIDPGEIGKIKAAQSGGCPAGVMSGLASGGFNDNCELTGVILRDASGYGDIADIYQQGGKLLAGEPVDRLLLGFAAAGLASTVALAVTLGASVEGRGGLSAVKALYRAGRFSKPLAASLGRTIGAAIDTEAVKTMSSSALRLETDAAMSAAQKIIRPTALSELTKFSADTRMIANETGLRGAQDALSVAQSTQDVSQAARLAKAKGPATRAILRLFGRGVLFAAGLAMTAVGWIFAFIVYLFALALMCRRLGSWAGRRFWRRQRLASRPKLI